MAETRKIAQHGLTVEQVKYSGSWYTPVDERIKIANYADPEKVRTQKGYTVIEHAMVPVGDRWAYTCRIEYPVGSGCCFPGSDFIDMKDTAGLAKAETSAIGRALGNAGIASEGSIASAEEMQRAQQTAQQPQREPRQERAQAQQQTNRADDWNPLADVPFRLRLNALGWKSVKQVQEFVSECGGGPANRDRCIAALEHHESAAHARGNHSLEGLPMAGSGRH